MTKKIIKFSVIAIYALMVVSYVFFADKALNIRLSSTIFFAHFYAFPVLFGAAIALLAALAMIIGIGRKRTTYFIEYTFVFPLMVLALSMLLVFGSADVKRIAETDDNSASVKIVELNAQNTLDGDAVAKIFKDFDADIAVFPEFGGYVKGDKPEHRLIDLMEREGISGQHYDFYSSAETEGNIAPVTIVVKKAFNAYKQQENKPMTRFGTVYLSSNHANTPDIVGLHTAPPLPGLMETWRHDLDLIGKAIIPENGDAVILGDFNATTRHGALNLIATHEDVLDYLPRFHRGTWGLFLPEFARSGIDHMYIPKGQYAVKRIDLFRFNGPDHMGVFVELSAK